MVSKKIVLLYIYIYRYIDIKEMGLKLHQYDTNTTAEIDTFQLVFIREIRREITVSREKSRNIQKRLLYFNRSEQ